MISYKSLLFAQACKQTKTNTTSHHKLKVHRAADVLQAGHGTLSFDRPAEEQLVRTGEAAVKTENTTMDHSLWLIELSVHSAGSWNPVCNPAPSLHKQALDCSINLIWNCYFYLLMGLKDKAHTVQG